ncbi:TPA: 30S ribosomal protein S8 [Candidatus Woesearchaeota archaeon]|nr:30S ribosomal protein S8 [archaeon GW2011_AR15]AJS11586.1 30S ribosomal protein S8 [uncultured archaeon]AJS11872.1 30S ribosomal protein S8 [uncultured archaeon]MBS3103850.1 30S ribosomal protein S8 [Candidatus Woesearchaeota archaeon]HIH40824.1 30S ribosomal protein S8 [Candidatus Woesearchaeota archaeon]
MSLNDPLANVLSHIHIEEKKGKQKITVRNNSKIIRAVLDLLKANNYVGEYKVIENGRGGEIEISLLGAVNKIGVVRPRHSVTLKEYQKFEKRYLPAFGFGFLIVSTNQGLMTQEEAIKKKLGGKLIAYVY